MGDEEKRNRAITARRQHLKSVMLQIAATELEKEESRRETEKQNYLSEHCPPLHIPGPMAEVQELCKQLHAKIDAAEEEKYDMEMKVQKSTKELEDMNQKLFDLRGKFKRPPLRRVRMSADAMLKALLGSKHKVCMDLRANLKQVKKEDTEKVRGLPPRAGSRHAGWLPTSPGPGSPFTEGKLRLRAVPDFPVGWVGPNPLLAPPSGAGPSRRGRLEEEHRGEVRHGGSQEDVRDRVLGPPLPTTAWPVAPSSQESMQEGRPIELHLGGPGSSRLSIKDSKPRDLRGLSCPSLTTHRPPGHLGTP
uniref:Troponin I, cardiac muscle n=1 Tax=Equus asinus TaxID=9793 RepID=A0A9L0IIG2_EQUAS